MEESNYTINLHDLSVHESRWFPESYRSYAKFAEALLKDKDIVLYEDELIKKFQNNLRMQELMEGGKTLAEALAIIFPNRFLCEGEYYDEDLDEEETDPPLRIVWIDLWSDYTISPDDYFYDIFFVYKLRQTDLLELDNLLNHFRDNYTSGSRDFLRFLQLALRKHAQELLKPDQLETINEWIEEQRKQPAQSAVDEVRTKGRPKRGREDKLTILSQEQTALLIYCLRKSKIILSEEFLNNKEAGHAFAILTGYSPDTIRQNLNKSEVVRLATAKNVKTVIRAVNDILDFIENNITPEE